MYSGVMVNSPMGAICAEVIVGDESAPMFRRGDNKRFVVGKAGVAYMLKVTNLTGSRIEVIATVDGRHVLDDEAGDPYRNHGFVITPRATYVFRGWRTSDAESRPFIFGEPESSVASWATGTTANLGVIGFAAHRERYQHPSRPGFEGVAYAAPAASFGGEMMKSMGGGLERSAGLGTGMGAPQHDPVGRTTFSRDGSGPDILAIGYDTEENLFNMGILRPADPNPFPATGQTGYAKFQG